jgi:hypothetical protein
VQNGAIKRWWNFPSKSPPLFSVVALPPRIKQCCVLCTYVARSTHILSRLAINEGHLLGNATPFRLPPMAITSCGSKAILRGLWPWTSIIHNGWMGGLMGRHQLMWCQSVICLKHFAGEVLHNWFSGKVEVTKHFVGAPASNQLNNIRVHFPNKKGGGASSAKGSSRHLFRKEAQVISNVFNRLAKRLSNQGWSNGSCSTIAQKDSG